MESTSSDKTQLIALTLELMLLKVTGKCVITLKTRFYPSNIDEKDRKRVNLRFLRLQRSCVYNFGQDCIVSITLFCIRYDSYSSKAFIFVIKGENRE